MMILRYSPASHYARKVRIAADILGLTDRIEIAGAIGVYLGWKRVTVANRQAEAQTRQAELTRRDHVAELFNRSVGQLNDDKLEIRLGAIFTLRQICLDFPDLSEPVVQLLTIYLKEKHIDYGDAERRRMSGKSFGCWRPRQESGMTLAARTDKREAFKIDLSGVFIRRTDLSNANLEAANLSGADCTNVIFCGANMRDAILDGAILNGADLSGARNLTRAQIDRAIIDERTILPSELAG